MAIEPKYTREMNDLLDRAIGPNMRGAIIWDDAQAKKYMNIIVGKSVGIKESESFIRDKFQNNPATRSEINRIVRFIHSH